MSIQITQEIFARLNDAANKTTQIIFAHTQSERGVHLETAIYAPAFLAGTLILRSTGVDFSKLEAGKPIFVSQSNDEYDDIVNDRGREILEFMQKSCSPLGLQPFGGWNDPVPDNHQPLKSGTELMRDMEKPFNELMFQLQARVDLHPYVAALTSMVIAKMGVQTLNPEISKAIALSALMAGCKTVPHS